MHLHEPVKQTEEDSLLRQGGMCTATYDVKPFHLKSKAHASTGHLRYLGTACVSARLPDTTNTGIPRTQDLQNFASNSNQLFHLAQRLMDSEVPEDHAPVLLQWPGFKCQSLSDSEFETQFGQALFISQSLSLRLLQKAAWKRFLLMPDSRDN